MTPRVTVNGCFDGLHAGHLFLLGYAAALARAGELWVGLNRDEYIMEHKGREPMPWIDRATAIMNLGVTKDIPFLYFRF